MTNHTETILQIIIHDSDPHKTICELCDKIDDMREDGHEIEKAISTRKGE